jgi:hypothetical protein
MPAAAFRSVQIERVVGQPEVSFSAVNLRMHRQPPVPCLSRLLQKFSNVFFGDSAWGAELDEEFLEMPASELPFERLSSSCPVVLKVQKTFGDRVEIRKIIGCQDLPLESIRLLIIRIRSAS